MKPKYMFLHAVFLIFCHLLQKFMTVKTPPFFNFTFFCTPKRYMRIHCLVLKNGTNYVFYFTRMISTLKYKWPPELSVIFHSKLHFLLISPIPDFLVWIFSKNLIVNTYLYDNSLGKIIILEKTTTLCCWK